MARTTQSMTTFIPVKFPSLNDYVNAERSNRFMGAKMKKYYTDYVTQLLLEESWESFDKPVAISFEWYEANQKRDPDNIIFAKKFILDGMVKAGLIPNDTQKYVLAFDDSWTVLPDHIGVMVSVVEYDDE